ncbi:hypothetical protein WUBG_17322, partial [Wuchereria bancrofti]
CEQYTAVSNSYVGADISGFGVVQRGSVHPNFVFVITICLFNHSTIHGPSNSP